MKRENMLSTIHQMKDQEWDLLVIGGGASGLGVAYDATLRGYKTLLLEQSDFAKGTSSRSTKLVHGGVRYLEQGDILMVKEALYERGVLMENAPHLVQNRKFVVPAFDWWETPYYTAGLKIYDMMAGKLGLGPSESISREETIKALPNINQEGLNGGVTYYDGQFDDARLAITLAQSIADYGGTLLNYAKVTQLHKNEDEQIAGVQVEDLINEEPIKIKAKAVVNATGVFVDGIRSMDKARAPQSIQPSQGVHIVLDRSFMQGDTALMIPRTEDKRVLFAVPWHDVIILGTTDTPVDSPTLEPVALSTEVDFILKTAARYLSKAPTRDDIKSVFAGLRPLAKPDASDTKSTKGMSRSHQVIISDTGLISVIGGKWTTYRKMGEDVVNLYEEHLKLSSQPCLTESTLLHGYQKEVDFDDPLSVYGNDKGKLLQLIEREPALGEKIHADLPYLKVQILWGVLFEMAQTVEDILSRRTRALLLDAKASVEAAPMVSEWMAEILGKSTEWQLNQLSEFTQLSDSYRQIRNDEPEF
ncbi:glycerol-3-phosphate dehydrogenase/oxidase [Algivirga pacifica]|uniref:Glycerol-3-phosphate dehydrogenase/oxidase n=1 Tax=Algivirga pacifica TaxID=1162670 RepID=A0ABP9DLJ6_9BACT